MSDHNSLLPASSAGFALTLDQNVSRDVRARVVKLENGTKNAKRFTWASVALTAVGIAALATVDAGGAALAAFYWCIYALPIGPIVWFFRRKASLPAAELNQDRDVAFIGPQGLVFFSDDGFYVEKGGGFKPYGVREPVPRRFDNVHYSAGSRSLTISSMEGYSVVLKVPPGWTEHDTKRVREKLDAFKLF